MISTQFQKDVLAARREIRDMERAGYERLGEGGGRIWELVRGGRIGHEITDVKIAYDRASVWVKVENLRRAP